MPLWILTIFLAFFGSHPAGVGGHVSIATPVVHSADVGGTVPIKNKK